MTSGRVVVVAPDGLLVARIADTLRSESYTVRTADAWDDAARLVTAFAPQVLVAALDARAPVPYELFMLRRSLGVRLVLISSPAAKQVDADAYLPSPTPIPELLITLRRLCGNAAMLQVSGIDRRAATRPKRGDVRPCPRCGYAQRFEEPKTAAPAWMCRNLDCLEAEFVRAH
jgi:DNA-binding response OmpR family regulator